MNFPEEILHDILAILQDPKLIYTLIIIFIISIAKWLLNRLVIDKFDDIALRYKWSKITTYFSYFITVLIILFIWLQNFKLGTFLGLFSAGLAIALRDLITNIIGWLFILGKRPFAVGDRIQIEETAGDVVDIRIFQFSIIEIGNWIGADQSTGRIVHIPNKKIFNSNLANYTADFPFIWNEITVLITFESAWDKAKNLLLEIAEEQVGDQIETAQKILRSSSRKYMIYYGKLTPIVYTNVKENGVSLIIRYLCNPRMRRSTEAALWENILKKFAREPDIDFAYPTTRFYFKGNSINKDEDNIQGQESGTKDH